MIISGEIHFLEWLIAQPPSTSVRRRVASKKSASILERLVQRWSRVFCIVDTMKQADYLQKICRQYHKAHFLQKPALILYELYMRTDRFSMLADFGWRRASYNYCPHVVTQSRFCIRDCLNSCPHTV